MKAPVLCTSLACLFVFALHLSGPAVAQESRPPDVEETHAAAVAAGKDNDAAPDAAANAGSPEAVQKALCALIEDSAAENGLPVGFFTRLIWKESRFRGDAVSPKGAQGIAQFMPG